MKIQLTATIVQSATVTVEVEENASDEQKRSALIDAAIPLIGESNYIIHECSDDNLIE